MQKVIKKKKPATGPKKASNRPSIFPNKKFRLQGVISKEGARCFEAARQALAKQANWKGKVSDADTIEFLAREFAS